MTIRHCRYGCTKKTTPIGSQSAQTANTEAQEPSDDISPDYSILDSSNEVNTQLYENSTGENGKNGVDYLGSTDNISVLIDKYKTDLAMLKAKSGAQTTDSGKKSGAQAEKATGQTVSGTENGIFDKNIGTTKNPATQTELDSYIEYALEYGNKRKNGEEVQKQKDSIVYGTASKRLVSDMKELYDVDVEGKSHVLTDNDIRHIDNSHGKGKPTEKYPVTAEDLKRIPDIVENYDNIYYVEKENGQKGIYYEKRHNGTTYYLEAVSNDGWLYNKQMIKVGTGTIPDIRGLKEQIQKRRAVSSPPDGKAPRMYAQDARNNNSSIVNTVPRDKSKVNSQNEYSSEYQKGAEHPNTVGGMESRKGSYSAEMNRTGTQPDKSITEHRYSDYDAFLEDPNQVVYAAEKKALERKVNNEYKGERTVWQETVDSVIDGDTYFTENGKYYVKNAEGATRRIAEAVYRFAKYLEGRGGPRYTANQAAEVPNKIGEKYVSKSTLNVIASKGGTNKMIAKIEAELNLVFAEQTYESTKKIIDTDSGFENIINRRVFREVPH